MSMVVRDAREDDLPAILAIHNHVVATSTAHYNFTPADLADRRALVLGRQSAGLPFLVAADGDAVAGYASFGPFRPQDGFGRTVEHMVYVAPEFQRRGVAALLLAALIARARALGLHVMLGALDAANEASIALHARMGFAKVGLMPQAGYKFGRYLDLLWMQIVLD
ncbi:N-acetyltransferase family protein [Lichenibacterium minor]|uniref:N-acetyltransferase family protein n=1 Tax=Lichenibacterium minor TaxID=2316528 RepID=A0A4Q2UEG6_9HYPH|nr:GNAT family N-acetyltransferase [Lichenibacterium minor]RYC33711.1 N-acetyltransferase family protein [Lichenibacterium minor]